MVRFRWPELLSDLAADRFDVAMSGITIRPERSVAGIFTVPVMASGAVVLVREDAGFADLASLDRPAARIAVNQGGHLERVTRAHFPRAAVIAIPANQAVRGALISAEVDAVVSDTLEAPIWLEGSEGVVQLGPFTSDLKAYLVHPDRSELAADLDAWLMARESDGTLAALRRRYLGHGDSPSTAEPVSALLAAVGERLDLMPLVAEAKRATGTPVTVPEREARVIDAALAATREAAREAHLTPVSDRTVRSFFEAADRRRKGDPARHPGGSGWRSSARGSRHGPAARPLADRQPDRLAPAEASRADRPWRSRSLRPSATSHTRPLGQRARRTGRGDSGALRGAARLACIFTSALLRPPGAPLILPARRAGVGGRGRDRVPAPACWGSSNPESLIGLPGIEISPATSSSTRITMLRAATCGSAITSATSLMGPQGTPALRGRRASRRGCARGELPRSRS